MDGQFKIPKLTLKSQGPDLHSNIPRFNWRDAIVVDELACGAFGNVYVANYREHQQVVVKRLRDQNRESKRAFLKEARLLHELKDNTNIVQFIALSTDPYAIMEEYIFFDFHPFGIDKKVSCLRNLLDFIDEQLDFSTFRRFQLRIAQDIAHGLAFLHNKDIAHRDLKPDNILITNQHYAQVTEENELSKNFADCPVKAKLTDFGESRATYLQTQTLVKSHTNRVDRGTPVYMPPELNLGSQKEATVEDMKKADVWSFGMTLYCLMNPSVDHPYSYDCSETGKKLNRKALVHFMKEERLPKHDPSYESMRVTEWWQLEEAYTASSKFEQECRPSLPELEMLLTSNQPEASLTILPLSVSQCTALEKADRNFAEATYGNEGSQLLHIAVPQNDGTNGCTFFCLAICDWFLANKSTCEWEEIMTVSENIITKLPLSINKLRNVEETYEPLCAYRILRNKSLVPECDLSEEFVKQASVFSEAGRKELTNALACKGRTTTKAIGLYTCTPYTFIVGIHKEVYFILDTHPISETLGGDGNGILLLTEDVSSKSCQILTQWILKRLKQSGVRPGGQQSLAWVTQGTYHYKVFILLFLITVLIEQPLI